MTFKNSNIFGGGQKKFSEDSIEDLDISNISSVSLSRTSKGVLYKWIADMDGSICYIKTGRLNYGKFSSLEPISEVIAFELGKLLGLSMVETDYAEITLKDNPKYKSQDILVSYSKNFLEDGEVFLSIYKIHESKFDYNIFSKFSPQYLDDLNKMLIFDFIINNTDRHLNNFGFICDEDTLEIKRFVPIFDNGSSLLSDLSDNDLIEMSAKDIDDFSICKPFINNQLQQLKLVKYLPKINLDLSREDICAVVDNFSLDISQKRYSSIVNLVCRRLNYVKQVFSKV